MVVFGLDKDFLFKSVLGHCAMWNILIWLFFILFSGGLSSDSPIPTYNPGLGSSLETAPQIHAMRLDDSLNSYTVSKIGEKFKFDQNSKRIHENLVKLKQYKFYVSLHGK